MRHWLAAGGLLAACGAAAPDDLRDGVLWLPPELREVSGLCAVDADTVACVQDELGALFFVDLLGQRPVRAVPFGERGDYEGVARVGEEFWVLRADGRLLRLQPHDGGLRIAQRIALPAAHRDWEGLCHDPRRGLLLVLPKDAAAGGEAARDRRPVFGVDPARGELLPEPVLVLDRRWLIAEAEARGLVLPTRTTPKGRTKVDLPLAGSELLVFADGGLAVLSAADRCLLLLDAAGRLAEVRTFDAAELPQPEGLALLADGRLLVASEGRGGPAVMRVVPR